MITTRDLTIALGNFLTEIQDMPKNTHIVEITYENRIYFGLVEKRVPNVDFKQVTKEIYKILFNNKIGETDAVAYTHIEDFKIFLYGDKNEFINDIIETTIIPDAAVPEKSEQLIRVEFSIPEKVTFELEYHLVNDTQRFSLGDITLSNLAPIVTLISETGENFNIEVKNVDCTNSEGLFEFTNSKISLSALSTTLMEECPVDTQSQRIVPATYVCVVDGKDVPFETSLYIDILNKGQIRGNFEGAKIDTECLFLAVSEVDDRATFATQDIDFLANAVFEIDEKLLIIQDQLPTPPASPATFSETLGKNIKSTKGVSFMAEMWARWIQTGRRTFSQCPVQYRDEVKRLLADIGLDENGQPLVTVK